MIVAEPGISKKFKIYELSVAHLFRFCGGNCSPGLVESETHLVTLNLEIYLHNIFEVLMQSRTCVSRCECGCIYVSVAFVLRFVGKREPR